jgi:glycosyltransferase involved in cell wall biosynthesis
MTKEARPSICYIVPSYTADEASHMAHLPHFLSEVGKYCDLHVIIQRGSGKPEIPNVRSVYVQRPGNHFQRALELTRVAYRLRRQGCKKFFIRISASAALELNLLSRFLDLQVYHWVSGQGKDLKPPWRKSLWRRLYYEVGELLLRLNIRLAYRFVTGPESMVKYFIKEYGVDPGKTLVLYNDIDIDAFKPLSMFYARERLRQDMGLPMDCPLVLFVGRVSPFKGGHYLIPIAHLLQEHLYNALLLVVGDIHIPDIVEIAKRERLCNIRFIGPIQNFRVVKYLHAADVFIMPSDSEGFPRVILEAMASGSPIVAFDVGGTMELLGPKQQRFVVRRGDLEAFISCITELVQQPDLRRELSEENLRTVPRFSTKQVANMFIQRIVEGGE